MDKDARIFIAGHQGLVGSALLRRLKAGGYGNFLLRTREELDLENQEAVYRYFQSEGPGYVFLAAAKVGGIYANDTYPASFIYNNLIIQVNVIHAAYRAGVKKLLFLGSSCIYPKMAPQPMKEEYLLTGPLEPTNEPYAVAKIAGIKMCQSYNRQYGTRFISVMPTNLYGPKDNYDPMNSHVLPALIRRFHEAKVRDLPHVEAWGTGKPRREFMYSDDMADACIFLMKTYEGSEIVNIGTGEDITIRELTEQVAEAVGYKGEIRWDTTKPDGTPRKLLDVSRLNGLGYRHRTELPEGIRLAYRDFLEQHESRE
ncbi:GDP-L-fucose synthase [bacterium]|nr:GDP-L-fucose synthase [bacterium]